MSYTHVNIIKWKRLKGFIHDDGLKIEISLFNGFFFFFVMFFKSMILF